MDVVETSRPTNGHYTTLKSARYCGDLHLSIKSEYGIMFSFGKDAFFTKFNTIYSGANGNIDVTDMEEPAYKRLLNQLRDLSVETAQYDLRNSQYVTPELCEWLNNTAPLKCDEILSRENTERVKLEYYPSGQIDPIAIIEFTVMGSSASKDLDNYLKGLIYSGVVEKIEGSEDGTLVKIRKDSGEVINLTIDPAEEYHTIGCHALEEGCIAYYNYEGVLVLSTTPIAGKMKMQDVLVQYRT